MHLRLKKYRECHIVKILKCTCSDSVSGIYIYIYMSERIKEDAWIRLHLSARQTELSDKRKFCLTSA